MFFDRCHPSEEGVPLPARPRQDAETLAAAAGLPQGLRHEHGDGDASTGRFLHLTGQSVQQVRHSIEGPPLCKKILFDTYRCSMSTAK